jgi:signal transduction histidine kinase
MSPDERWRRGHWRRRIGCFVVVLATLLVSIGVLVLWLVATLLGLVEGGSLLSFARAAAIIVLVAGGMALVQAIRFAGSVARPLDELAAAAGRVESGDLSARVRVRGSRGLREFSTAFNTMAARLEAEEERRRRLLADLGHELRTPIAVIEGHLEAVLDGVYPADAAHLDPILDETRVLARLVEDLRTVSLAEAGSLALHREPVDPGHLVADVTAALAPRAAARGARLETDLEPGLPELDVDPVRIHQVLSNLLDNAIRYTPADGAVHVRARRLDGSVEVSVTDEGPGLAPELRESLFDRFVKSAESPGSGLGLAIAKAIVEAHGGTIRAEAGEAGRGTSITVSLPIG